MVQVEPTIRKCLETWLSDSPAQREMYQDLTKEVKTAALRRQAIQILGLPEEFCLEEETLWQTLVKNAENKGGKWNSLVSR